MSEQQLQTQRRGRRIAMSRDEIDEFLHSEVTCRVGTVNARGPHVTPLWLLWHDRAIWLYSITGSQRWKDLAGDPRNAVLVDGGTECVELRRGELTGTVGP